MTIRCVRPLSSAVLSALLILLSTGMVSTGPAFGQPVAGETQTTPAVAIAEPQTTTDAATVNSEVPQTAAGTVTVIDAWGMDPLTSTRRSERKVTVGDRLVVQISDIATLLDHDPRGCYSLRLFLDSGEVEQLEPVVCHRESNQVRFAMEHIDRSTEPAWLRLLEKRIGFETRADISVGFHGQLPIPTSIKDGQDLRVVLVPVVSSAISLALFVATVGLFFWLARSSEILRASGLAPTKGRRPFSLSRAQMAFWFLLVLGSFLLLSLITGDMVDIPASILGLIGIAASTYIGSEMVAAGKRASHQSEAETDPSPADSAAADDVGAPAKTHERLKPSRGFMLDLLSDPQGVSFARFQIFVWTIVLGFLFLAKVWQKLAMPDFSPTLLGLMGISAGTYLGFKVPEGDEKG